jgi:hypothetical protein
MTEAGFCSREPVDAYGDKVFNPDMDLTNTSVQRFYLHLANSGLIGGLHCGIPCRTWGILARSINKGSRRKHMPLGDGSLVSEIEANAEADFMVGMVSAVLHSGGWITIENPVTSLLFSIPRLASLIDDNTLHFVHLDQCCFGLGSPPGVTPKEIWKKPTIFCVSDHCFDVLGQRCLHQHTHTHTFSTALR